ncbi:GMP synthase-like glutamine amidotransferase [Saccharothrix violaceirubra]|uniref:GMP synthase-like glutamine amidotransferase n=1 Tax=Saccharothrix violaceirubra TaxID=413306 RepID=A0A7W7TAH6_9PSEU|nr:GMP synthase-like glutamine amidotransferase [Saccharothrix violaceirubra]
MTRVLVVQPDETDPPARLGDWLADAGADPVVLRPYAGDPVPDTLDGYRALVCLGGVMGALDDVAFPWLADLRRLLSHAVAKRVPVLAVCLGAQLLAVATGGQVRRGVNGSEIGLGLVAKRDVAKDDVLFAELPWTPDVLQFHQDEIALLPPTAELLASSPAYANQAFRVGPAAYGLQFHIETTADIVLDWVVRSPGLAASVPPSRFDPERLARGHEDIEEVWRPFVERFVRFASGAITSRRELPLV